MRYFYSKIDMKRGLCINNARVHQKRQKQVEIMLQKSGRPQLTGKKTLPSRQHREATPLLTRPICYLLLFSVMTIIIIECLMLEVQPGEVC